MAHGTVGLRSAGSLLAAALLLAACSPAVHRADGIITQSGPGRFCVGLPAAAGFCTAKSWASDYGVIGLAQWTCVRVIYTGDKADEQSVEKIESPGSCPH